jgi:hypothetical protein
METGRQLIWVKGLTPESDKSYTHCTLIQRFGGALNLNIHLMCMDARMPRAHGCAGAAHMLFLDGVYVDSAGSSTRFRWVIRLANHFTIFNLGWFGVSNKSIVCLNRSFFTNAAYAFSVVLTEAWPSRC